MKMATTKALWIALGLLISAVAVADTIDLATGLDSNGHVATAANQVDARWTITHAAKPKHEGTAYTVFHGVADWYDGWLTNGPKSAWIAANPDDANGNGTFTATRTFTLAPNQAAAGSFTGLSATVDDSGVVLLNGKEVATIAASNWGALQPITIPAGTLVPGLNTLEIKIDHSDTYLEAVRFEGVLTVPPASSWFTSPLGLLCLCAVVAIIVVVIRQTRRKPASPPTATPAEPEVDHP